MSLATPISKLLILSYPNPIPSSDSLPNSRLHPGSADRAKQDPFLALTFSTMPAAAYDPTASAPAPPAESVWPQGAPGPPSPFPWSTNGMTTPPRTPEVVQSDRCSPARASASQPIGSSQAMLRAGSADSGYGPSLSPASAYEGFSGKASPSWGSPRLGLGERRPSTALHKIGGVRTPSGFEFLDWGHSDQATDRASRSL